MADPEGFLLMTDSLKGFANLSMIIFMSDAATGVATLLGDLSSIPLCDYKFRKGLQVNFTGS